MDMGERDGVLSQVDVSPMERGSVVSLISTITRLVIESDASLSDLAFFMLNQEGQAVGSKLRLPQEHFTSLRRRCVVPLMTRSMLQLFSHS